MTRVSDNAGFAKAVAGAGALPMLALGVMRGPQVEALLTEVAARLGTLPWGAGVLGFMDPAIRKAQLLAVKKVKPPYAIVAGGRADIAEELEAAGIRTYLHVPTAALLKSVIQRGLKRFVFEGRECGGHVGPLGSLALWEVMTQTLLAQVPAKAAGEFHILFAGGIHDARSGAMVSTFGAKLAERGFKIGALMGTAYLFTHECVAEGAIGPRFQQVALDCRSTVLLESGPGQSNRCAATESCAEFDQRRIELRRQGATLDNQRDALDDLLLGRLRLASKGLWRDASRELVPVDDARQQREGMFMLGEVATLREELTVMASLHDEIADGTATWLQRDAPEPARLPAAAVQSADIAIIGIELIVPGASNREAFWKNLLRKFNAITEIPKHRWDWRLYYDIDPKTPDRIASRWGGFIEPQPFDPLRYGLPPNTLSQISTAQLIALELARRVVEDAGYKLADIDRENTAVIFGVGYTGGFSGDLIKFRSMLPLLMGEIPPSMRDVLPEWTPEVFPGHLSNVVAGRIANRFDLGGINFGVDSACASSLAAVHVACRELTGGHANLAIVGGIEMIQSPSTQLSFGKTGALSPTGQSRPFDTQADGIVFSEGGGVVVLKRRTDAERDGDRIYAVIRAVAGSSDGKSLGMTAPRAAGQIRALDRAYFDGGLSPAALGLYEAHATGTPVGDSAELEAVSTVLRRAGAAPASCAIGSVKSLVGHTGSAAGMTSLVKSALALHYRTLPPHAGVEQPLDALARPDSPLYLLDQARPWFAQSDRQRHAAISAFGFGGTNFHTVLDQYEDASKPAPAGGEAWPAELLVLAGRDRAELIAATKALDRLLDQEAPPSLRSVAYACARAYGRPAAGSEVATIVARDVLECLQEITGLLTAFQSEDIKVGGQGLQRAVIPSKAPKIAFLFPGQGSQHPNMMREVAVHLDELRAAVELADRVLEDAKLSAISHLIYPPRALTPAEREAQRARLVDTAVAQPAIGAISLGLLAFLEHLGLQPAMLAGHSYGEWVALQAAGVFTPAELLCHSAHRGRLMANVTGDGAMAAILAEREIIERAIPAGGRTVVANHNAPAQTIVSGPAAEIDELIAGFAEKGIRAIRLTVAGAFHSPLMAEAQEHLAGYIDGIALQPARLPVYGNADGAPYGDGAVAARLKTHLLSPVEFVSQIRRMQADGADLFVEVGPGTVLTKLVHEIVKDGGPPAIALDGMAGGLGGLLGAIAAIWRAGAVIDLTQLFRGRVEPATDLAALAEPPAARGDWLLDGQWIWHKEKPVPVLKIALPPRSVDTAAQTSAGADPAVFAGGPPTPAAMGAASGATVEVYAAYQETMRQFLAAQERIVGLMLQGTGENPSERAGEATPALRQAAGQLAQPHRLPDATLSPDTRAAASPAPTSPTTTTSEIEPRASGALANDSTPFDSKRLAALIVAIAEKATGYPTDMLGVDADVEAELGIGSIKRLEILETLTAQLPPPLGARLSGAMDRVVRLKTFAGWADQILAASDPSSGAAAPNARQSTAASSRGAEPGLRHAMRGDAQPLDPRPIDWQSGAILVTEDELGIAERVLALLGKRGVAAILLPGTRLSSPSDLAQAVGELVAANGRFGGVVHLAGFTQESMPALLDDWRRSTERQGKSLVRLLRFLAADLQGSRDAPPRRLVTASLFGGRFGRERASVQGVPSAGAGVGLLNTLREEWANVLCKAIDLDPRQPHDRIAGHIVDEILGGFDDREIGYPEDLRTVYRAVAQPLGNADASQALAIDKWVVLATGGARGITAEIVKDWARPGMTFILVGRIDPASREPTEFAGLADEAALRRHLIQDARRAGTLRHPASIESEITAIMRRREVLGTISELRAKGASVEYQAMDLLNAGALAGLVNGIYARHGRIDAVLHGAGTIEDKLLIDKTDESIDRVFDTKVDLAFLLYRLLRPESLKTIVFFSSVAGRFGNRGQADYAAANEVLNRLAWRMAGEWPTVRVLSINWSAWSGVGMAVGAMDSRQGERFSPITPSEGCHFLRNEIERGRFDSVEVIAGDVRPAKMPAAEAQSGALAGS